MRTLEIVHIVPLGFERSIVVKPLRKIGASRVHILAIGPENAHKYELSETQRQFTNAVMEDIRKLGIEVEFHDVDLFDFESALSKIAELIVREQRRGADVWINISGHGKLVAVAASIAGWYHGATIYYVLADRYSKDDEEFKKYGRSICINPRIIKIPKIEIAKLSEEERFVLSYLINAGGEARTDEIYEVVKEVFEDFRCEDSDKRREKQKILNKLNRRVLDKLEAKNYIERVKVGRYNKIILTDEGRFIALLEKSTFKKE